MIVPKILSTTISLFFRFFHKNGLKSSFLGQIAHFKNLFYLKFYFKKGGGNRFQK